MLRSLARQVVGRLVFAIGASVLVTLAASVWLYYQTRDAAEREQLQDAHRHFSSRIPEWEAIWETDAASVKARLDYSRLLERRDDRAERLVSYFTALGSSALFERIVLLDARGGLIAVLPPDAGAAAAVRSMNSAKGWYFDERGRLLYRVYRQDVWLGANGGGRLFLFKPMDNALLADSVYPYTEAFLVWDGRVVASSLGSSGVDEGETYLHVAGLTPANSMRWADRGATAPQLLLRRNVRYPLTLLGTILPAAIGAGIVTLLAWLVLGGWLAATARRVLALGSAAEWFGDDAGLSSRVRTALVAARNRAGDELSTVADELEALMQQTVRQKVEMETRNRALRESERRFRDLVELSSDWFWEQDRDLRFTVMSIGLDEKAGLSARTTLGKHRWELPIVGTSDEEWAKHKQLLAERKPFEATYQVRNDAGELRWFLVRGRPVFSEDGEFKGYRGMGTDMTERVQAERAMRESEARYRLLFEANPHPMWVCDPDTAAFITVNDAAVRHYRYSREEFLGMTMNDLRADGEEGTLPGGMDYCEGVYRHRKKNGELILVDVVAHVVEFAGRKVQIVLAQDVTARRAAEARIQHLAYYDALSELPNRALLQDRVTQILGLAERDEKPAALLFIDLDRFKNINDSLGHDIGDQMLQVVARRLHGAVREVDTVSRFGGDEFVILLPETGAEGAAHAAQKILEVFANTFEVGGYRLNVSTSIGIGVFPDDGRDFHTLVRNADTAMYHAKESGRNNYQFFAPEMNAAVLERLVIEHGLRNALGRAEFELHYQPQLAITGGRVVGVEALLRWRHSEWGLVMPSRFVSIAEDSGLIGDIGAWVLEEACRQNRAWQDAGLPAIPMAVNISAVQFRHNFYDAVRGALERSRLAPEWLELELTESVMTFSTEPLLETLHRLELLGVKLAIDDFGTGYSSLSQLKRVPIGKLKIDQSFVRDIVNDSDDRAIVRAVIQMGRSMQLAVVAEGVEHAEQAEWLLREGCYEAQGYYYCHPLSAARCREFIESHT